MHKAITTSAPYLIRSNCGKVYDLFRAEWISIKDETFVDHTLYLNPDGSYLYATCNVFRDKACPVKYDVITKHKAKEIFFSRLTESDRDVFFPEPTLLGTP